MSAHSIAGAFPTLCCSPPSAFRIPIVTRPLSRLRTHSRPIASRARRALFLPSPPCRAPLSRGEYNNTPRTRSARSTYIGHLLRRRCLSPISRTPGPECLHEKYPDGPRAQALWAPPKHTKAAQAPAANSFFEWRQARRGRIWRERPVIRRAYRLLLPARGSAAVSRWATVSRCGRWRVRRPRKCVRSV